MSSQQLTSGFRPFSLALALFCLPSALFPLTWLLSPQLSHLSQLSALQIDILSIIFWIYPLALFILALLLNKLYQYQPRLAQIGLAIGFLSFYTLLGYIICLLS